jgi:hypothetical protein
VTNTAAKLSNILAHPRSIGITAEAYKLLTRTGTTGNDGRHMWGEQQVGEFGGVQRRYRSSSWRWVIS